MNILCIDATASFLDFALRAEAQGHSVRVWMANDAKGNRFQVGDGLLDKVSDWRSSLRWADLILTSDNAKYRRELQSLHNQGYPVFFACDEGTDWELDRIKGQQILEAAGVECLPYTEFKRFSEAEAYQRAHMDKRFVCKPCADVDKSLSYVAKSSRDMLYMLQRWGKDSKLKCSFIFQEFFPGIEMAVGGWVGRDGFLSHFLENFEFKKLMPGEVGCNTGEQGTVMRYVTAEQSRLAREVLLPIEANLIRIGYRGYIDVAVMIGKGGDVRPLEFTSRHGWPLFQIQQVLHPDVCGWMADSLEGRDTFKPSSDIALGVVMTIPQFPYNMVPGPDNIGFPLFGVGVGNRYNLHPCEVKLGEGLDDDGKPTPMLVTAGTYIAVITGTGPSISRARERAYKNLKQLEIPNSPIYRTDIGCRLEDQLPVLQKHGYAESWSW